jgi:hypothetical protein
MKPPHAAVRASAEDGLPWKIFMRDRPQFFREGQHP